MLHGVTLGGTGKERGDRHPEGAPRRAARRGREGPRQHRDRRLRQDRRRQRGARGRPAGCTAAGVPARIISCVDVPEPGARDGPAGFDRRAA